ncbi:MAG: S8 family peptidase [Bacteroidia bacterium]
MKITKSLLLAFFQVLFISTFAQKKAPDNWFNLDRNKNKVYGVSTERAYTELLKNKKSKTVIVAVIDGGTEPTHEDLKDAIWTNEKEIPGNGIDDDHNGYIDDIHGWNFIGGKNGENVNEDNLEVTRIYAKYKNIYDKADTAKLTSAGKSEYYKYQDAKKEYLKGRRDATMYSGFYGNLITGIDNLKSKIKKEKITLEDIKLFKPNEPNETMAQAILQQSFSKKIKNKDTIPFTELIAEIENAQKHFDKEKKYNYNTELDTRKIVGDNYDDVTERYYGNNDVKGPSGGHGTHVAGIIGALRYNNIGIKGVADNVRIMIIRVVPDGDERDKDVANGIRYAVDNGATVINMSFGKAFSWNKKTVDDAVKYAENKDVLMVHAAGNDAKNTDKEDNFPSPYFENRSGRATGWIEVGASTWMKEKYLVASFSNFGKNTVDVFAPGMSIYSTVPDSKYASYDGTSMASPVTAGCAALIRSYYPNLTAVQVKEIITRSVTKVKGKVVVPGSHPVKIKFLPFYKEEKVPFGELCASGGIVNVYKALQLADQYAKK